jgi:uncharacterized protein (UPF0332 family)
MPFNWSDYLSLAEWLATNGGTSNLPVDSSAAFRTSVSRAYYTAFHAALGLLVRKSEFVPQWTGADHAGVMRCFQNHQAEPRKRIGLWLGRLKDRRRKADYDVAVEHPRDFATDSVKLARLILRDLQSQ